MSLYNAKNTPAGTRITKFTDDLDVEETKGRPSSYIVSGDGCDCPAGHRNICRHRDMLRYFISKERIDSQWFYDYDNEHWYYLTEEGELMPQVAYHAMLAAKQRVRPVEKKNAKPCPAWRRL